MAIELGRKSKKCFDELDLDSQHVVTTACNLTPKEHDWSIVEAYRPVSIQQKYFKEGVTHIDGITRKGAHNYFPAKAWDIYPYLPGFGTLIPNVQCYTELLKFSNKEISEANIHLAEKFVISKMAVVAGIFFAAAEIVQVEILWGTDWDKDGNMLDHNFQDYPHFQKRNLLD